MSFSSEVITLIDELAARSGIVIDWTAENIMPYLTDLGTRFITLVTWKSILGICFTLFLLCLSILTFRKGLKMYTEDINGIKDHDDEIYTPMIIIGLIATLFCTIMNFVAIPCLVEQILECKFLPEKIILDYLKDILAH